MLNLNDNVSLLHCGGSPAKVKYFKHCFLAASSLHKFLLLINVLSYLVFSVTPHFVLQTLYLHPVVYLVLFSEFPVFRPLPPSIGALVLSVLGLSASTRERLISLELKAQFFCGANQSHLTNSCGVFFIKANMKICSSSC